MSLTKSKAGIPGFTSELLPSTTPIFSHQSTQILPGDFQTLAVNQIAAPSVVFWHYGFACINLDIKIKYFSTQNSLQNQLQNYPGSKKRITENAHASSIRSDPHDAAPVSHWNNSSEPRPQFQATVKLSLGDAPPFKTSDIAAKMPRNSIAMKKEIQC